MSNTKRLDHVIASLVHARTLIAENDTYDFDLKSIMPVVETATTALVVEVEDEVKEIGK